MIFSLRNIIARLVSCLVFFVLLCAVAVGQVRSTGETGRGDVIKKDSVMLAKRLASGALLNRFSFKTNAFEWLLTIPNVGVEFDLSSSKYQRTSIGLSVKYNWGTYHEYAPSSVFNMFDVRPEFRYYYRTRRNVRPMKPDSPHIESRKPHLNSARYIGAYADYGTFSFKFGPKGIQGQTIGLGASYGWGVPLYQYDKGAIDMEFGFSLGLQVAKYDVFTHNPDGYYYTKLAAESKDCFRFTPFPVVSEIRVAFAWRSLSIKEKYRNLEENPVYRIGKAYSEQLENMRKELDYASVKNTLFNLDERNKSLYEKGDSSLRTKFVEQVDLFKESYLSNISNALYPYEKSNKDLVRKKTEQFTKKMESLARKVIKDFDREFRDITGVIAEGEKKAKKEKSEDSDGQEIESVEEYEN